MFNGRAPRRPQRVEIDLELLKSRLDALAAPVTLGRWFATRDKANQKNITYRLSKITSGKESLTRDFTYRLIAIFGNIYKKTEEPLLKPIIDQLQAAYDNAQTGARRP